MPKHLKKYLTSFFALGMVFCSLSCSDSEPEAKIVMPEYFQPVMDRDSVEGMLRILAAGHSTFLGSEYGKVNERPVMKVEFDYNFSVGRHEVTCKEFNELKLVQIPCDNDSLPATNVTFYDAVLFANGKSVKDHRDTAYSYTKAVFDTEGHCTDLEGFVFRPETDGYRLPTEAEWVLVASTGWNPDLSWNSGNSDYVLHPVCSVKKTGNTLSRKAVKEELMLCDMAGNAMEWVNDWLGYFKDTTILNYTGAPDGGSLGERVVKGGSYRNDLTSLNVYSRGDIYTVTSSTRADYVGFRLAYGKIANATWLSSDGSANGSRVLSLVSSSTMQSLVGTFSAKLAFRNNVSGNLSFVNYASGRSTVREIHDTLSVYHPDISPDGSKVAFCTKSEGVSGRSELYVRNLDVSGFGLVKLDVESAAIPRWRVTEDGDTTIVYVTDAGNNKNDDSFKATSTWQVSFANGKFGTPKKLFDGAYHGGVNEKLAVTGARLLRAKVARKGETLASSAKDEVWYNGEQACNVSLSKDGSARTLFLDFGGKTGADFVGEKYRTHQRLLIADESGKLVQSVAAPENYTFDHSEWALRNNWSDKENFAVATLTDLEGSHVRIALINLADSSVVELIEGDDLWHPSLWIKHSGHAGGESTIDWDSAGVYLGDGHNLEQARYRIKIQKFWEQLDRTEVLMVGSSRSEMGLNPDLYPEWKMLNVAVSGIDGHRDLNFIRNYALKHADRLKAIVFSVDLDNWRGVEDHWALIRDFVPGYIYDENHNHWEDGIPEGFVDAVREAYPAEDELVEQFSERGNIWSASRGWNSDPVDVLFDSVFTDKQLEFLDSCLQEVEALTDIAAEKGIYLIGIIFPQAPQYANTGSFGVYGLQRSIAVEKIQWLNDLAKRKKHFILMDEYKMGYHNYADEMAYNRDHLSSVGAEYITTRLVDVLKGLK
ncbi:TIGR02171 family lipoprotein [Fibrobacter sp. HC4]|uniref:TIGR02171 family lipoprotein n=1 Tax=Fibrobacter sp. HC4 TaxID=3239812 RepID=UPI0035BD41DD|nr:hypothetical protein [Fibrobacter succinogenes]